MVTDFWRESAKIGIPHLYSLAIHNGWKDRNMDACVNTADDLSKSVNHLVNFGRLTPDFCRRVCEERATR